MIKSQMSVHLLGISLLFLMTGLSAELWAEDGNWPTWRGQNMTGLAPNANPPISWSEEKNIKWKIAIPGSGSSTPIIWNDRIFILTAIETDEKPLADELKNVPAQPERRSSRRGGGRFGARTPTNKYQFDVICLDRKTGKTIWQKTAKKSMPHEGHHRDHGFASFSPVTDGKHLWVSFGSQGLHCFDIDGNHKWSKDLGKMHTRNSFGEGSSPSLVGNAIVVVMDHEGDSFIVALDKLTGKQLWRKPRDEKTSWSTPLVINHDGKDQIVVSGTNLTRSYDPKDGNIIWQCKGLTTNVIPTPVTGFGMVYCTSGYRGNALLAIKLGKTGDLSGTDAISWQVSRNTPYVPSPLLYGDKLYLYTSNNAQLSCYDAKTGKEHYIRQRIEQMRGV